MHTSYTMQENIMLQVRLFGQFDLRVDGKPVTIPSRAGQSLFAFLVLTAGTAHRREKLAGTLWSDTSDENARRNLRQELWRIRKALAAQSSLSTQYLLADEITVAFNPNVEYWLDTAQLERSSNAESASELMSQLSLYRGELLPGFYDDWVVLERERLYALFEQRMERTLDCARTVARTSVSRIDAGIQRARRYVPSRRDL